MLPGLGGVTCGKVVSCEEDTDTAQAESISFACCFLSQGFKHFQGSEYMFTNLLLHAVPFSWKLYFGGKLKVDFAEDLHRQM